MITFGILTLGCKVNSYESEALINLLTEKGWKYQNFNDVCDVYIINTCTVTSTSDQKSRQMIHKARRNNPNGIVCAMGCFVQLHTDQALEIADIVIGSNQKLAVYDLVNSYLETRKQINAITDVMHHPEYEEMKISHLTTHTRGFIKIQDGCENYCAYCAIPFSRGKIRSREPNEVINEIKHLTSEGTKEVILAGINTGAYGRDLENINLAKLLKRIMEETSIYRVRISSIELMEISDELLDIIKQNETRIAMHFHIPLQAGSEGVLKRMRRKYDAKTYYNVVMKIKDMFDDVAITTDMLAGFVGETKEEFDEACAFIRSIGYASMHIFPYSRREGTLADKMEGHLDKALINERAKILMSIAKEMQDEYNKKFIGKTVNVLVETKKNGFYQGHTSNYLDVHFATKKNDYLINQLVDIKLIKYEDGILYGELKEEK